VHEAGEAQFDAAAVLAQGAWMRRLARRRGRERLRRGVERRAAREEAVEGGQDSVARLEVQRLVADAVLALDEPYRTAVLLRHQEGLDAAEIGRRTGCTPAAARQHVARGLTQLRGRLDRRFGGERGAWCAAFSAALRPAKNLGFGSAETAALAAGGIGMASKSLVVTALVAASVAGAMWLVRSDAVGQAPNVAQIGQIAEAEGLEEVDAPSRSDFADVSTVPDVAFAAAAADPRAAERRIAVPAQARAVHGRVIDRAGRPIAGAAVALVEGALVEGALEHATTQTDGTFELPLTAGAAGTVLRAEHAEHFASQATVVDGAPVELVLAARPVLEVRLFDAAGVLVVEPGWVRATVVPHGGARKVDVEFEHDGAGVWRSSGAPAGTWMAVLARAHGFATTDIALERTIAAEDRSALDVPLLAGRTLAGRVVDAQSKAPLPGAKVWAEVHSPSGHSAAPLATAVADGTFVLRGVEPRGTTSVDPSRELFLIGASVDGYAASTFIPFSIAVGSDQPPLEIGLVPANLALTVRLTRAADGSPAVGFWAFGSDAHRNMLYAVADTDGGLRFSNLAAGPLALAAYDSKSESPEHGFASLTVDLAAGERRHVDLVLGPPAALTGRLLDSSGRPLANVHLVAYFEHHTTALGYPLRQLELTTDTDSAFAADPVLASTLRLALADAGDGRLCLRPPEPRLDLPAGRTTHLELVAAPGITVAGTARTRGSGAWRVRLVDASSGAKLAGTDVGATGTFAFGPFYPLATEVLLERDGTVVERLPVGPDGAADLRLGR